MNDDANAAQARTSFQSPEHIIVQFQALFRNCKDEFARLQDERLIRLHHKGPHDPFQRRACPQIDKRMPAMLENVELASKPKIN